MALRAAIAEKEDAPDEADAIAGATARAANSTARMLALIFSAATAIGARDVHHFAPGAVESGSGGHVHLTPGSTLAA